MGGGSPCLGGLWIVGTAGTQPGLLATGPRLCTATWGGTTYDWGGFSFPPRRPHASVDHAAGGAAHLAPSGCRLKADSQRVTPPPPPPCARMSGCGRMPHPHRRVVGGHPLGSPAVRVKGIAGVRHTTLPLAPGGGRAERSVPAPGCHPAHAMGGAGPHGVRPAGPYGAPLARGVGNWGSRPPVVGMDLGGGLNAIGALCPRALAGRGAPCSLSALQKGQGHGAAPEACAVVSPPVPHYGRPSGLPTGAPTAI